MGITPGAIAQVFGGIRTKPDFDREAEEFLLRKKQMQQNILQSQAEIDLARQRAQEVDVDKLGEKAFWKAAQGAPLSNEELAAAQFLDAKSGGVAFDPVTGNVYQKPRISDKIGLEGLAKIKGAIDAPMEGDISVNPMSLPDIEGMVGGQSSVLPVNAQGPGMKLSNPIAAKKAAQLEDAYKRELASASGNSRLQQSIQDFYSKKRMENSLDTGKTLPTAVSKEILGNKENLRKADDAYKLLSGTDIKNFDGSVRKGDKNATGAKGMLPEIILQRIDGGGVDARAAIADLGSLIIHDRSGAAVTASEYPRLAPFIPKETDNPDVARKKLARFISEYNAIIGDQESFYGEQGYNVPESAQGSINWEDLP